MNSENNDGGIYKAVGTLLMEKDIGFFQIHHYILKQFVALKRLTLSKRGSKSVKGPPWRWRKYYTRYT